MKKTMQARKSPSHRLQERVAFEPHPGASSPTEMLPFLGNGISAQRVVISPSLGYDFAWQGSSHYLALHELALEDGETFQDDGSPVRAHSLHDLLTFVPAGARVWGWSVPRSGNHSFTAVYFDPSVLEPEVAERFASLPAGPRLYFSDPVLRSTLAKLHGALSGVAPPQDPLYLESLCVVSALELCTRVRANLHGTPKEPGQLGSRELALVRDYIESHLAEDIALTELAKITNLSRFHFLRSFRKSVGETPHQYVIRRRIERSKLLLQAENGGPIHLVAKQVGFKSVSRFALTFRRLVGGTPAAFRNELRSKLTGE